MPTRFLSDAEIERLEAFPESIDRGDLARFFRLDGEDLRFVRQQNGAAGRLGIALQLCSLRWLGFVPGGSDGRAAGGDRCARGDAGRAGAGDLRLRRPGPDAPGASTRGARARRLRHRGRRRIRVAARLAGRARARARAALAALRPRLRRAAPAPRRASGDRSGDAARGLGARARARENVRAARCAADGRAPHTSARTSAPACRSPRRPRRWTYGLPAAQSSTSCRTAFTDAGRAVEVNEMTLDASAYIPLRLQRLTARARGVHSANAAAVRRPRQSTPA
jgi:Domain of unknown function (DUF4158)